MIDRAVDQALRIEALCQWMFCLLMLRLLSNPDLRLALETQAMGCLMRFQNPGIVPEVLQRRLRYRMKLTLVTIIGVMVWGAL